MSDPRHATKPASALSGAPGAKALHPHVLLARWEIYLRKRDWLSACNTAQALIAALPNEPLGWIYRSFALQQLGRIQDARDGLLAAARRFPTDWRIAFNLAAYTCQLGDRAGAWNWLDRAAALGDAATVNRLALETPAFEPLGPTLRQTPGANSSAGPI